MAHDDRVAQEARGQPRPVPQRPEVEGGDRAGHYPGHAAHEGRADDPANHGALLRSADSATTTDRPLGKRASWVRMVTCFAVLEATSSVRTWSRKSSE